MTNWGRCWALVVLLSALGCGPGESETASESGSDSGSTGASSDSGATSETSGTSSANASSGDDGATSSQEGSSGETPTGWVEPGWGYDVFHAFEEGAAFPVVFGPQGEYMFTLALQGGGFEMPLDPSFDDPDIPVLGVDIEVEGTQGPMGPLVYLRNYTVPFATLDDAELYEYVSVWMTLPESVDPAAIEGRALQLHLELDTADGQHLEVDRAGTVGAVMYP